MTGGSAQADFIKGFAYALRRNIQSWGHLGNVDNVEW
jgi:hypothetical protein